jgi:5'-3' exonuclease
MGIKNLTGFLKKYTLHETVDIESLKYKRIGIDTPILLYKFKAMNDPNTNDWLGQFANMVTFLRKRDVHPIFVFEGSAPPEKSAAQEERRRERRKMVLKTDQIEQDLATWLSDGTITDLLLDVSAKHQTRTVSALVSSAAGKKRVVGRTVAIKPDAINEVGVREEIDRRRRYEISITSEDVKNLKKLLTLMGVVYLQSSGEAETDCVRLWYDGRVDYVFSEDTDVLVYHDPKETRKRVEVITNLDTKTSTFTQISKKNVLDALQLTPESFMDFCIMCGTDYNKNIYRIGTETAYKLVSKYYRLESVPLDVTVLNHEKVRSMFTVAQDNRDFDNLPLWCTLPRDSFKNEMDSFVLLHGLRNVNVDTTFRGLVESEIDGLVDSETVE